MLHRFSKFLVACTVLLILAGSLVTSHDAGLSVPDWPTSYGWNMFTFPPSMWVANILYEHGHRLIASSVGFLTIVMAVWLWFAESRRWLRWFGVAALGSVVAQGLLGGLTVLFYLPAAISTAHAGLAEIFFCMTVAIALFTSPRWIDDSRAVDDPTLRRIATTTTVLIYTQILVGATMRHTGAGLAIPDFPWMFGHVVPDHWSARIAIHFTHRVGALLVTTCVIGLCSWIWSRHRDRPELTQAGDADRRAGRDPGDARRAHRPDRPRRLDQQFPRRLRRAGADDLAGDHAAQLARDVRVRARPGELEHGPAKAGHDIRRNVPSVGHANVGGVRVQPDATSVGKAGIGSVRLQPDSRGRS